MHVVRAEPTLPTEPMAVPGPVANMDRRPDHGSLLASYHEVRDQLLREMDAGRLDEAMRLSEQALCLAMEVGDEELIDQAYCTRCNFAFTLDDTIPEDSFRGLREILMRNRSYSTGFSAAYNLAYAYSKQKKYKKALFYAQISRDRAMAAHDSGAIAKSHNEIGNCLLADSYFTEAIAEYERALELASEEFSPFHVAVYNNLGYSKVMVGDFSGGFHYLYAALRWCRRNPTENLYEMTSHLSLAFAFTELGRWRYAWCHGRRALRMAESMGARDFVKMGLYVMGEIEKSAGDIEEAYHYYTRMQKEFYPEEPSLPNMLLVIDTKAVVNLRA